MRHLHILFLLTILLGGYCTASARETRLSSGKSTSLPSIGIRISAFRGQSASQLPDPVAVVYQASATNERLDAFDPYELWRRDQTDVLFEGAEGRIWIAEPKYPMPKGLQLINDKHVQLKDYEAAIDTDTDWSSTMLDAWVEDFAGKIVKADKIRGLRLSHPYKRFTFDGLPEEYIQGYLLRPKRRPPIFILFVIDSKIPAARSTAGMQTVMRSITAIERKEAVASRRFQSRKGRGNGKVSTEFEATRKRVIQSVKGMADWWYVETPNYILKSDLGTKNRRLVLAMQQDIEILRNAYATFIPPIREIKEVSVITAFAERDDYVAYVPKDVEWSGGLWHPGRRELIISPVAGEQSRQDEKKILPVVYHEGFHQYIYYALDRLYTPMWWNEGHAMLFESGKINRRNKTIAVELNESRYSAVAKIVEGGRLNLDGLMMMDQPTFYQKHLLERNYALAWGLVYFFRKGYPQYKGRGYDNICDLVMKATVESQDWRKGSSAGIKALDMKQLELDFIDFYQDRSKVRLAEQVRLFPKR